MSTKFVPSFLPSVNRAGTNFKRYKREEAW